MGENSNQKQCGILGENNVNICDIPEREMTIDQAMEYGFLKHKCLYPDNRPIIEMNLTEWDDFVPYKVQENPYVMRLITAMRFTPYPFHHGSIFMYDTLAMVGDAKMQELGLPQESKEQRRNRILTEIRMTV